MASALASVAESPAEVELPGVDGRPKVLLVDDRPDNLHALERALAPLDADLMRAGSGQQALSLMLRHRFAVVLLDVQMPAMDGFETATLMREHDETRDVPVIFVTAISTELRYIKSGYASGAVDYLLKPIDPDVLLAKVRVFLDLERQRTGLQQAISSLRRLSDRQKVILNTADEGILGLDADHHVVFSNPAAERLLKCDARALCGLSLKELFAGEDGEFEAMRDLVQREGRYRGEDSCFTRLDGTAMPVDFSCAAIVDDERRHAGGVLVFNDITERKNTEHQLMRLARYDELTGLANRTLFREFLRKSMARTQRGGRKVALMFIDLDRFKAVNDELGHSAGDKLLRSVGARLLRGVREGDLVARLGGDEFAIVLDDIDSAASAGRIAEKLITDLGFPHIIERRRVTVCSSIGIVVYEGGGDTADGLIRKADTAMYEAKRRGRNSYRYFTETMSDVISRRSLLEADLAAAIENDALTLHFQPQFGAGDGALVGFEALLRWYDKQRGLVSPEEFVPIAEEAGLIEPLGNWVMREACAQLAAWRRSGHVDETCRMSVNVSVLQLHSGNLLANVQDCLQRAGLEPEALEIELTESTVMDDTVRAIEQLAELGRLGVRIAIDDFGTGYSSLSHLQRLPLDTLKVDRSFVIGLGTASGSEAIVQSILALAHSLSLSVVAEGVETEAQRDFLRRGGCSALQGFLLARPVAAPELAPMLEAGWPRFPELGAAPD